MTHITIDRAKLEQWLNAIDMFAGEDRQKALYKASKEMLQALAAQQEHEPENEPFVSLASVQEPVQEPMAKVDANDEDYWDAVFAMIRADEQEPAPVLVPIGEVRNGEAYFYNGMYTNKTDVPDGTKLHTTPPQNHV